MKLTQCIQEDQVKHLKLKTPLSVSPEVSIAEAIKQMQSSQEGYLIVTDEQGSASGIFTERDVLRRVIGEHVDRDSPIKEVMSKDLASVKETDALTKAFGLMHKRGLRHLPVLDDGGIPVGVISVRRVMEYLVEHFPQAVYNQPPVASPAFGTREGA